MHSHTHYTHTNLTWFSSLLSPYMEAISPLPLWLLRIGGHFILPVLIRMSAGSVTCNLSTKPQQVHRDGEHSHNDIILDRWRGLGGDRWCRLFLFLSPLFFSRGKETCESFTFTSWALFPLNVFTQGQFSYTLAIDLETFKLLHYDSLIYFPQPDWYLENTFEVFFVSDHSMDSVCLRGFASRVSLSTHIVGIDTCFMYLPGKAIFQITLSWAHSTFYFPKLIHFSSFWPLLSPWQFSQRKTAESAKLFNLEVELEVLKGIACDSQTMKILEIPSLTSPPLQHLLTVYQHWDELCWLHLVRKTNILAPAVFGTESWKYYTIWFSFTFIC